MLSLVSLKSNGFVSKLFCEPRKEDYVVVEMTEIEQNLEWLSRKEDQKNLQKDYENLTNDMRVSILEYKSKHG